MLSAALALTLALTLAVTPADAAGISTDGTLGAVKSWTGQNADIAAALGRQVGGNLFHSFNEFSIAAGLTATFCGPNDVQNVVARVTGGASSSIDGTLKSDIAGANVFLVNPHGILFGPGARVDVSGSFVASTADYVQLGQDGRFDARNPAEDVLTSAPPSAFGFLSATPAAITLRKDSSRSPFLTVKPGKNLALIGGDVTLDGGQLFAQDGAAHVVSVRSTGKVTLEVQDRRATPATHEFSTMGAVRLTNAASIGAGLSPDGGGRVVIRGGTLTMNGASVINAGAAAKALADGVDLDLRTAAVLAGNANVLVREIGDYEDAVALSIRVPTLSIVSDSHISLLSSAATGKAGGADIRVSSLTLSGGFIQTAAYSAGDGADIAIEAQSVSLLGAAFLITEAFGAGTGGNVEFAIGDKLELLQDSKIISSTARGGSGGDLAISAGRVLIQGNASLPPGESAGIITDADPTASGRGGDLRLDVSGSLELRAGGNIQLRHLGSGRGGDVSIAARSLTISGQQSVIGTVSGPDATGRAGDMEVNIAESISLTDRGGILAETKGDGTGGDLIITASSLSLAGGSAIGANSVDETKSGQAGNARLTIGGAVEILGGSGIMRTTLGPGSGGDLHLSAGSLLISGSKSGIAAESVSTGHGGPGGEVHLTIAGSVEVLDGGLISLSTKGAGDSGDLFLSAGDLNVSGDQSAIGAQTFGRAPFAGSGGDLTLDIRGAATVGLGGDISATTFGSGRGGTVMIRAGSLSLIGGGPAAETSIAANSAADGGSGDVVLDVAGAIDLRGGAQIGAATLGTGRGGSVRVTAASFSADGHGSGISAQTRGALNGGAGGNLEMHVAGTLRITGGALLSAGTRGSGKAGDVSISAGSIAISGAESGIGAEALATANAGDGGTISITAGLVTITGDPLQPDAQVAISTSTLGPGKAGAIALRLGDLQITAGGAIESSTTGLGDGGSILVTATGEVRLSAGGRVTTQTTGLGNAGGISLAASSLVIDGTDSTLSTGLVADSGIPRRADLYGTTGSIGVQATSIVITGSRFNEDFDPTLVLGIAARSLGLNSAAGGTLPGAGSVTLAADTLTMNDGLISAETIGRADAGNVIITAANRVLVSGGHISSSTVDFFGTGVPVLGDAGGVRIDTGIFEIESSGLVVTLTDHGGSAGDITINAGTSATVRSGGVLFAGTSGAGTGGDIFVSTPRLEVDGQSAFDPTEIVTNTVGAGRAGEIKIAADHVAVTAGSINTTTSASGRGGDISITASDLAVSAFGTINASSSTPFDGPAGDAGHIRLEIERTLLLDFGSIAAETDGDGDGGSVTITGEATIALSFGSISTSTSGAGEAGDIAIAARSLSLTQGGGISSVSRGGFLATLAGDAGDVRLELTEGLHLDLGFILAETRAEGRGGNLTITGDAPITLRIGNISTSTSGAGDAGRIEVEGRSLELGLASTISSLTTGSGNAGSIDLTLTQSARLGNGASISAATRGTGAGGNIQLATPEITLIAGGRVTTQTLGLGNAGRITVSADSLVIDGTNSVLNTGLIADSGAVGNLDPLGSTGSIDVTAQSISIIGARVNEDADPGLVLGIAARSLGLFSGGALVGGAVTIDTQSLTMSDGLISAETIGLANAGNVTIAARDRVAISGGFISSATTNFYRPDFPALGNAGGVQIDTSVLEISNGGQVVTLTDNGGSAGDILVNASGRTKVQSGGVLLSGTRGAGHGGDITIATPRLDLVGEGGPTGPVIAANTTGEGKAGDIRITGDVLLVRDGAITTNTVAGGAAGRIEIASTEGVFLEFGAALLSGPDPREVDPSAAGSGGDISISTKRLTVDGSIISGATRGAGRAGNILLRSEIVMLRSGVISTGTDGAGSAGDLSITAHFLEMSETSQISTASFSSANAGRIAIELAESARLSTGASISAATRGTGGGGEIRVKTPALALANAVIEARTGGSGDARSISIEAGSVTLAAGAAISTSTRAEGDAGAIRIQSHALHVDTGSEISSVSEGRGDAGQVALTISGPMVLAAGGRIAATTQARGQGGEIRIDAGDFVADGGRVEASAGGLGGAGSVTIEAHSLTLRNKAAITSSATGAGLAGSVALDVSGSVALRSGSSVATTSLRSSAGRVAVRAGGRMQLDGSTITVQARAGDAGQITIDTPRGVSLRRSGIVAEAGGSGGNITIDAGSLALDSSRITANAVAGDGGLITLNLPATGVLGDPGDFIVVSDFVRQSSDSRITASSQQGVQGALRISAPEVDLSNSVEALSAALLDASAQLREQCARRLNSDFSSFLILGRGGVAESPEDAQASGETRRRAGGED